MSVSARTLKDRMASFMEMSQILGVKATHQRIEIYREVASSDSHPDVNTIYHRVKKRIPTIALDTVYRNLKFLADHGLVTVMGLSHEHLRVDANLEPHHHFVCVQCGLIRDFSSAALNKLPIPREAKHFGRPTAVQVEVKGICSQCQEGTGR
jgi:Fur family peroxide stress response transcriptional regulator